MSKIEWTEKTWNPIVGCSHASAGCDHCYAERMAARQAAMACGSLKFATKGIMTDAQKAYTKVAKMWHDPKTERTFWKGWNGKTVFVESALDKPLKRKTPTTFFVCSMSDLFHPSVTFEWIDKVFAVMALCPQHTFQVLTKRSSRMVEYFSRSIDGVSWHLPRKAYEPLPNVWLGVTVENQEMHDKRILDLLKCPAVKRFISVEPMLGPVNAAYHYDGSDSTITRLDLLDWVICGGESGPGARPMHPDWARSLRDQCKAADVPFFFKQWGEFSPAANNDFTDNSPAKCRVDDQWVDGIGIVNDTMFRVGKKRAGCLLDGGEHKEMPKKSDQRSAIS